MASYSFKPNILGNPQVVALTESGMASILGGKATIIPFERVVGVRLWFDPTRFDAERYRCRVDGRNGERILFQSSSCEGLGNFVAQPEEYRQLILDLHARLAAHSGIRYRAGLGGLRYTCNVVVMCTVFVLLAHVMVAIGMELFGPFVLVQLLVMAWFTPRAWRWIRRNRPLVYEPTAIPSRVIPPGSALHGPAEPDHATLTPAVEVAAPAINYRPPLPSAHHRYTGPGRPYDSEDFGPIAEPGDDSWCSVAGTTTHWADAERYAEEANEKLIAGLIGPPADPPPQGEQPLAGS